LNVLDAVRAGDEAAVREAVGREPGLVDARDEAGVSAVLLALYRGRPTIAGSLADSGAPLDLFAAAAMGDVDDVAVEALR